MDPAAYYTPDVVADFSHVTLDEIGKDRVRIEGGNGRARPETLKVSVGYHDGFQGEGEISYAGPGALGRAQFAQQILTERLERLKFRELRFDLIGVNSIHGPGLSRPAAEAYEVRVRATAKADDNRTAAMILREVEALYTNGPAGGGGVTGFTREVIAMTSTLIARSLVKPTVHFEEA